MEWGNQINQVLRYIEDNLNGEIDYNKISNIGLCHIDTLQRFFVLNTGISITEYIRRRRLNNAARELWLSDTKIVDIALKYGYESSDTFCVAFKRLFGITPSEARNLTTPLKLFPRISFNLSINYISEGYFMINELKFNELKENAKNFKYSLFEYCDYGEIASANIIRNDDKLILVSKEQEKITNIYFAADNAEVIADTIKDIKDIKNDIQIGFVPSDLTEGLENAGFVVLSDWIDFFNKDIANTPTSFKDYNDIQFLQPDEHEMIKEMTTMCVGQSRGFESEKEEWFGDWVKNNDIIILKDRDKLIGYNCVSIYDMGSGVTVWIRRIAVKPEYQGKGYGKTLVEQAIVYGINKGAVKSFLASDALNDKAFALYKKCGFVPQSEHGEITMKKLKPE